MKILVVSGNYPSLQTPNYGAFVYNLMQELSKKHQIEIITPFKLHYSFKKKTATYGRENCKVYRPKYLSVGNKKIGGFKLGELSSKNYTNAVNRVIKNLSYKPDLIYTHFLSNAFPIIDYANNHNIPIVVASGESSYTSIEKRPIKAREKLIQAISHIICVSNENKTQLEELGFDASKISVIPNAVDYNRFKTLDKLESKQSLGLSKDKFIVGFIGHFIHRKGPNRIIQAIKQLNDPEIELVCVGSRGTLEENNFTTIIPPVANERLPEVYNAFDVFVLPTLHEGNCNVIEEAKAVSLPIISSLGTSVEEQIINNETGILIDPLNVDEIAESIKKIKDDRDIREKLISNLHDKIGDNSLENRANKISSLLQNVVAL